MDRSTLVQSAADISFTCFDNEGHQSSNSPVTTLTIVASLYPPSTDIAQEQQNKLSPTQNTLA